MYKIDVVYATVKTNTEEWYRGIADLIFQHDDWRITDIDDDNEGTTVLRIEGQWVWPLRENVEKLWLAGEVESYRIL